MESQEDSVPPLFRSLRLSGHIRACGWQPRTRGSRDDPGLAGWKLFSVPSFLWLYTQDGPEASVLTLPSVAAGGSYLFWDLSLSSLNPERKNHKARGLLGQRPPLRLTLGATHASLDLGFSSC